MEIMIKGIEYSISLLTINQLHHKKEMEKFSKSPLMKEYYEHHKTIYEDLEKGIKKISKDE